MSVIDIDFSWKTRTCLFENSLTRSDKICWSNLFQIIFVTVEFGGRKTENEMWLLWVSCLLHAMDCKRMRRNSPLFVRTESLPRTRNNSLFYQKTNEYSTGELVQDDAHVDKFNSPPEKTHLLFYNLLMQKNIRSTKIFDISTFFLYNFFILCHFQEVSF